jgi:hypothetical protein
MGTTAELEKRILDDIELYGWHVIKIPEDTSGPTIVYSIGFNHSFEHPEILIIGLEIEAAHFLINRIGDAIREGLVLKPGHFYSNLFEKIDCYFTSVDSKYYKEYAGYAEQFYQGPSFPILQCIYPTLSGIYPWQVGWPEQLKKAQPILGPIPKNNKGEEVSQIEGLG